MTASFTDPTQYRPLYSTASRQAGRTAALRAAKTVGADAATVIADLAVAAAGPAATVVADIGCGRGTTTLHLTQRFPHARMIALDLSTALLQAARQRISTTMVGAVGGDFHHLPLAGDSLDLAVAAFCLYHSPQPSTVIAEIARCLTNGGYAVMATKSADSYHELDLLMATSGLDPDAQQRPSLYATFHSGNAERVTSEHLQVQRVEHHRHVFRFRNLDHAAAYLVTSPKYQIPSDIAADPQRLATALRARTPDRPTIATSTVTYLVASRP